MSVVVSFTDFTPPARYDAVPWTAVRVEEAAAATGTWAAIETITLSPADTDPENPAARSFTTTLGTAPDLWYRVVFVDAAAGESEPSEPIQNTADASEPYATVTELARILKIRAPTVEQEAAMQRVLDVAAGEIDSEIDLSATATPLAGWQLALAEEVNLERAVEHWRQQESPFGLIGLGPELPAERTAQDSWARHANKLAPLKDQWGLA
jgi:hypothetical protein